MLNTTITLVGDSASTRDYALQSWQGPNTVRANAAASPGLPETLSIQHSERTNKTNGELLQRHNVRFVKSVANSDGVTVSAVVQVSFEHDIDPAITAAIVKDMFTQAKNLLDATTIGKLLNNEP